MMIVQQLYDGKYTFKSFTKQRFQNFLDLSVEFRAKHFQRSESECTLIDKNTTQQSLLKIQTSKKI